MDQKWYALAHRGAGTLKRGAGTLMRGPSPPRDGGETPTHSTANPMTRVGGSIWLSHGLYLQPLAALSCRHEKARRPEQGPSDEMLDGRVRVCDL